MIEAADLKTGDIVLEVGPGFGTLTLELAKRVKKVIVVEQDKILIKALRENLAGAKIDNVEIIEGDILKISPEIFKVKSEKLSHRFKPAVSNHFAFSSSFLGSRE